MNGLKIEYNYPVTSKSMESHLMSENIFKFTFIGHGAVGCILGSDNNYICPKKFTKFGISELSILACESNDLSSNWQENVSLPGSVLTIKGFLGVPNILWASITGEQKFILEHGSAN